MTEFELGEMLHNQFTVMWQAGQMYFTLVSAYLIASYMVGTKLTRQQNAVITSLYVVWITSVIIGQITSADAVLRLVNALLAIDSVALGSGTSLETESAVYSFVFVQIAGVLASLWFMWSIRHPKTE